MILNTENYCISCRHRLLGHTTKQPLSNFEPREPWKYNELWGLRPDPGLYIYISAIQFSFRKCYHKLYHKEYHRLKFYICLYMVINAALGKKYHCKNYAGIQVLTDSYSCMFYAMNLQFAEKTYGLVSFLYYSFKVPWVVSEYVKYDTYMFLVCSWWCIGIVNS